MPPYGYTLSKTEIQALISYIRLVSDPPYQASGMVYAQKVGPAWLRPSVWVALSSCSSPALCRLKWSRRSEIKDPALQRPASSSTWTT